MSSFRQTSRFLRENNVVFRGGARCYSRHTGARSARFVPVLLGGAAVASAYGVYRTIQANKFDVMKYLGPQVVHAAAELPESQPSVFSQTKDHAVYLTIHLKPGADVKACAKVVAALQTHVDIVVPKDMRDEDDEIWAGVGFGPNFYAQVGGKTKENYVYPHRKGTLGDMPSTGGDIFIHTKSNAVSKLFELTQRIMSKMPEGSVEKFEDIYSFVYKNGRDLSGFIDGTENQADDEGRQQVAVEKGTGGSYVITQKWIHDMKVIGSEKPANLEKWVGRTIADSTELSRKSITSHVARMTGGNSFEQKKPFEIVRQSMPYGSLSGDAGLFFIGYSASPQNLEFMLSNMVGGGGDPHNDDIMRLTRCVAGTYFYFPGANELKKLA